MKMRTGSALALAALLNAGLLLVAVDAAAQQGSSRRESADRFRRGDPGAVVAAQMALSRQAQEKGQWTAIAEAAADSAIMFAPGQVRAKDWLKRQANPAQPMRWQPHQVWASCDGTLAVSTGAWQRADGTAGSFTTVWQRQRRGAYKWLMDLTEQQDLPLAEPDMIGGSVAECQPTPGWRPPSRDRDRDIPPAGAPVCEGGTCSGASADGTLAYTYSTSATGGRALTVQLRQQGEMREVTRVSSRE
ncbi:MAG TPA: hypothetical protein VNR60_01815 [Croceibacterium sp.]|nr:hypothetical protein [Croceibacterium sp.]